MSFNISPNTIDSHELSNELRNDSAGACVCFEGWVRDHNDGESVIRLEYEAHDGIAMKEGQKIVNEACTRFDLLGASCIHRVGVLEIGDCAVWVGVSAGHRAPALDACRYIIDELKHRLHIWKKEHYSDGHSGWINWDGTRKREIR